MTPEPESTSRHRAFLEVADVTDAEVEQRADGSRDVRTRRIVVAGAMIEDTHPTELLWACVPEGRCKSSHSSDSSTRALAFVPHFPEDASGFIELRNLRIIDKEDTEGSEAGIDVRTHDQQPVVATVANPGGHGHSTVMITPYLIASESDLRVLMECKKANARSSNKESARY